MMTTDQATRVGMRAAFWYACFLWMKNGDAGDRDASFLWYQHADKMAEAIVALREENAG